MKSNIGNYIVHSICDTIIEFTCDKSDCDIISEAETYMAEHYAGKVQFFIYKNIDQDKPFSVLVKMDPLV